MATMDRYAGAEHPDERASIRGIAWLAEAATWFALAVVGMVVVFIGLAIDAWRHNNGAGEESLLSLGNPGHLVAAVGLGITSVAVLAGFSVTALKGVATAEGAIRRMVPVTAAWIALAVVSIASVTYIGASGVTIGHNDDHGASTASADDHGAPAGDAASGEVAVASALENEGIDTDSDSDRDVAGALNQGASGQPGGEHDHGQSPTFTQLNTLSDDELLPMFPKDTVTADDLPAFKDEVAAARAVALELDTVEKAVAAGYVRTTSDVPFMGQHYLNFDLVRDGKFDAAQPEGLLFSKIDDGPEKLVGVWYLQLPGIGGVTREAEPVGFAGDLDLWHAHVGLCLVGLSGASEGETEESCSAKGGRFTADLRWMMHLWVTPETTENPLGVMAYLNEDLYEKQQAVAKSGEESPSGVTP